MFEAVSNLGFVRFYVEAAGAHGAPSIEHDGLPGRFWFDLEADDNRTTALTAMVSYHEALRRCSMKRDA
jgi:hypothetical protein